MAYIDPYYSSAPPQRAYPRQPQATLTLTPTQAKQLAEQIAPHLKINYATDAFSTGFKGFSTFLPAYLPFFAGVAGAISASAFKKPQLAKLSGILGAIGTAFSMWGITSSKSFKTMPNNIFNISA